MSPVAAIAAERHVERMEWPVYKRWLRRHVTAGEHGFIVGSTGEGKSFLAREVVPFFGRNIVVLDGKGGDDPSLKWPGFHVIDHWPPRKEGADRFMQIVTGRRPEPIRVVVTKKVKGYETLPEMRELHLRVLRDLMPRKGRKVFALYVDEAQITSDPIEGMGLKRFIGPLLRTKRYDGMSVIQATQWPTWIGPSSSREATHRWAFRVDSLDELGELSKKFGEPPKEFVPVLRGLRRHQFVYKHKPTGRIIVSKVRA